MDDNPYQAPRSLPTGTPPCRSPSARLTYRDWLAVPLASIAGGITFEFCFYNSASTLLAAALSGLVLGGITSLLVWLGLLTTRRGYKLPLTGMILASWVGLVVAWGQWIAIRDYYDYYFGPFDFPLAPAVYVAVNLTVMQAVLHVTAWFEK